MKLSILFTVWIGLNSIHINAQSARQDIEKRPKLAAGKYMAYENPVNPGTACPGRVYSFLHQYLCPSWITLSDRCRKI